MKSTKTYYLRLSLCYFLLISQAHSTDTLNGWDNPQDNFQPFSQINKWDNWSDQLDDEVITGKKLNEKDNHKSYLDIDISLENESPIFHFSYVSEDYLNYNEGSPLKKFVEDVKIYCYKNNLKEVSIDLSNHFFSIIELEGIYNDLKKEKIKISSLNLSRTGVDSNIKEIINDLLKQDSFKYINICETPASEDKETFKYINDQQKQKVIFITPKYLKPKYLEVVKKSSIVSSEIILSHQNYYKKFSK